MPEDFSNRPLPNVPMPWSGGGVGGGGGGQVEYLDTYSKAGKDIGQLFLYNTGTAWLAGMTFGGLYGVYEGVRTAPGSRFRLVLNSVLNKSGTRASVFGNALGVLALFYTSAEYALEEYVPVQEYVPGGDLVNPVVASAASCAFYTITRAPNVIGLATVLGGVTMGAWITVQNQMGLRTRGIKRGIFF